MTVTESIKEAVGLTGGAPQSQLPAQFAAACNRIHATTQLLTKPCRGHP